MNDQEQYYVKLVIAVVEEGGRLLAEALAKMLADKDLEIERLKTMAEKQAEEIERLTALAKSSFWRSRAT
jgi:hypothetical protein